MIILTAVLSILPWTAGYARVLTLQQCRDSAMANNHELKIARQKMTVAGHDRKIAMSNYFPDISVSGAYMYNSRDIHLIPQEASDVLTGLGTPLQGTILNHIGDILNKIGNDIDSALELDTQNIFIGAVSVTQPVFTGGKIVAANKIASLAEELAQSQYDTGCRQLAAEVDKAYWQIVSISWKARLAEDYSELLQQMLHDTEILVNEGMATQADLLSVKVRFNEAQMLLTKTENGLSLSKMLLCQLCGMDMDSDITLADEQKELLPVPETATSKGFADIIACRPEIRSLELAGEIYRKKATVERAGMMPQIAVTANYLLTNPNIYHGFSNTFAGMFNVGVAVKIPIIHGCESWQKVRKAKAEAAIAEYKLEDARDKIMLQITKLRKQEAEAREKLEMAGNSLESAEENLRTATIGYSEGVIPSNTVMVAQSAWMKAHSEYIDAGVELQMTADALARAECR